MSRILDTVFGSVTVSMQYDIEIEHLFDIPNLTDEQRPIYEAVQEFILKYGTSLSIDIEACIDGGYASFDCIEDISSEKTLQTIDEGNIPKFLMEKIEAEAETYAEDNGLEAFLW